MSFEGDKRYFMIRKFIAMSLLAIVAVSTAATKADASLNILLTKVSDTTATLSFTGAIPQTLSGPVGSTFTLNFSSAISAGVAGGTITSPSPPVFVGSGFVPSTMQSLAISGSTAVVVLDQGIAAGNYARPSGVHTLTGAGFLNLMNGSYVATQGFNLLPSFSAGPTPFGTANLTVAGVPEPASMVYGSLLACSAGIGYIRRRRNGKTKSEVA